MSKMRFITSSSLAFYLLGCCLSLILTKPTSTVLGGPVCFSWCNDDPTSWIAEDPGEDQKCNWKRCAGCPECPIRLYECPSPGDDPFILPSGTLVKLMDASRDRLCTLTKVTNADSSTSSSLGRVTISPVGRSYDRHDWENVAGEYMASSRLTYSCRKYYCEVEIPSIDDSSTDVVFQLSSFDLGDRELDNKNMISRFLEQATFGPTRDEINSWDSESIFESTFPSWISNQMNINPTYHREYYRKRIHNKITKTVDIGQPLHPCDKNSRWTVYALNQYDVDKRLHITSNNETGDGPPYLFTIDGIPRTEVENIDMSGGTTLSVPGDFKICSVTASVGGRLRISVGGKCKDMLIGNPPVRFVSNIISPPNVFYFPSKDEFSLVHPMMQNDEFIREIPIEDDSSQLCHQLHINGAWPAFASFPNTNEWFLYDPRLVMQDNTPTNPIADGGGSVTFNGATCANVPKTFLNIDSCHLSNELSACGVFEFQDAVMTLNNSTNRKLYELTGKYVYAVAGLTPEMSPCTPSYKSRWQKIELSDCPDVTLLDSDTIETISNLLEGSSDTNPWLRDIFMSSNPALCDIDGTAPVNGKGIKIAVGSDCWENVHPHHYNVYDMTYWTKSSTHPGNKVAADGGRPNPIKAFAKNGEAVLVYPHWHPIERWGINEPLFTLIGKYNDEVHFQDLPEYLRLESVATEFGAIGTSNSGQGTMVCGSPGEVGNDLAMSNGFSIALDEGSKGIDNQKERVWTMIALNAQDQLRQRMAWALSQILTIGPESIRVSGGVEIFLNYYDIFVRHAFGNFRDILKEVSYSPMMGEMLSYMRSKSTAYMYKELNGIFYPDENYAREIMQLFTIGTIKLKMDGTPIHDANGTTIQTYDNDDIMTYAKAWTGFTWQSRRGNIEDINNYNRIDPMKIVPSWRDMFPKMNLNDGYIGDGYPLCADLPKRSFLRKGATYQLLGSSPYPELQDDNWIHDDSTKRLTLVPGQSNLYNVLCNPSVPGGDDCNFKSQVVLNQTLSCNNSSGVECSIDTPRVIQVNNHTFYEYVRLPCVELPFYNDGKKISGWKQQHAMCANPKLPMASEACCTPDNKAYRNCEFVGERMAYDTAVSRCQDVGKDTCHFTKIIDRSNNVCNKFSEYHWNDASCNVLVKIDDDGEIAIVHEPEGTPETKVPSRVNRHSPSFFRVNWLNNDFPNLSNNCKESMTGASCEVLQDGCLCKTTVVEQMIWTHYKKVPKWTKDALAHLTIGSPSPDTFDAGTYDPPVQKRDVKLYYRAGKGIDADTIIEVTTQHGQRKFFKNLQSTVFVQDSNGTATSFSFRNPPHFVGFVDQDERDAHYETDAVLDSYFYHGNTAPFLAIRFIQRFGVSNPSPRFVKTVAEAFVRGYYNWDHFEFGSGQYGDLQATLAAILLDRESRSALLDMDPAHGSLKEPLIKVIGLMRSMEFEPYPIKPEVHLNDAMGKIGQMAHNIPSVFSFFLPEYAPPGPLSSASLVAPEAQLQLTPNVIGLLNGVFGMVKYGLSICYGGFGTKTPGKCSRHEEGNYGKALGELTFSPNSVVPKEAVNELATLLTAGRLSSESRQIIQDAYNNTSDREAGLRLAQQLILTTAEFHSTNLIEMSGKPRRDDTNSLSPTSPPASSTNSEYKAIVFLLLSGGCDSYNMLVPHSDCQVNSQYKDMYQEYADVRGDLALSNITEQILDASDSSQVCNNFFLHPNLPYLKTLYDQKDALFLANTGILTEPVTKYDWKYKTQSGLFAHNFMQKNVQQLDPSSEAANTGILGRMTDVLTKKGYDTGAVSISDDSYVLLGTNGVSPPVNYISNGGVSKFNVNPSMEDMSSTIKDLNNATTYNSGLFAETWSETLYTSIEQNEALSLVLENTHVTADFPPTKLGNQLELVSRMIKAHSERGKQRDVFFVTLGGFDTHSNLEETLIAKFTEVNDAIESFALEMNHQTEWDNVVMMETSDFARTITPNNGDGTDHGWGGNYFMLGGNVNGGRILGEYPDDLTSSGSQTIKRGRMIPTTSWDEVWNGIGEWFGVTDDDDLDEVLPNREKFHGLFTADDLFVVSGIVEEQRRKYLRQ